MTNQRQTIVFRQSVRVVLRPLLREDIPLLVRWMNDPEVTQYLAAYQPMMEADEEAWFDGLSKRKGTDLVFAIVVDGNTIGVMGLHRINQKDGVASTGAYIGEKEYWGKGYGTEAKMLLLDYAFNTLNLRKICSSVIAYNGRSYRYSQKCGYREEGRLKKHRYKLGEYWDEILLAVFKEDWRPLWEKFCQEQNSAKE